MFCSPNSASPGSLSAEAATSSSSRATIQKKIDVPKLRWMWADAQLFSGTHSWAEMNPMRWSSWTEPLELAATLDLETQKARPVQLCTAGKRGADIFPTAGMAAEWIRERHNRLSTATRASSTTSGSEQLGRASKPSITEAKMKQANGALKWRPPSGDLSEYPRDDTTQRRSLMDVMSVDPLSAMRTAQRPLHADDLQKASIEPKRKDSQSEKWEQLQATWGYLRVDPQKHDQSRRAILWEYLQDPTNWGIGWKALEDIEAAVQQVFRLRRPLQARTVDIVREIVVPECAENRAPCALVRNHWQIKKVQGFVSHPWQGTFAELMASLRQLYSKLDAKPALFISAFAIFQDHGFLRGVTENDVDDCPFLAALQGADHFTAVLSKSVDVCTRSWCILEFVYAKKLGLYPDRAHVVGPRTFARHRSSCVDSQASASGDREKILKAILCESSAESVDKQIAEFRAFQCKSQGSFPCFVFFAQCWSCLW